MASWPASLPQKFHQNGFQISAPVGSIRTGMSTGQAFQRRRFTAAVQPVKGRMFLDATQYQTLIDFWENTLGMGSLDFDWVHPITGVDVKMRFIAGKAPSITAVDGDIFGVNMEMEILP